MISDYISLPFFLVSFAVGVFFVYILGPETKTVYIYPSPQNYTTLQYKDASQQCFQFEPVESPCPLNPFSIKEVPVQM